jgi:hypothetical protein
VSRRLNYDLSGGLWQHSRKKLNALERGSFTAASSICSSLGLTGPDVCQYPPAVPDDPDRAWQHPWLRIERTTRAILADRMSHGATASVDTALVRGAHAD